MNNTNCASCDFCNFCASCNSCYSCFYSTNLRMSERMIFCIGEGKFESKGEGYQKRCRAWNKDVSPERLEEIIEVCKSLEFKLDPEIGWKKSWENVQDWSKVVELPEFDLEITKKVTGLDDIPTDEMVEVIANGKYVKISKKSFNSLFPE